MATETRPWYRSRGIRRVAILLFLLALLLLLILAYRWSRIEERSPAAAAAAAGPIAVTADELAAAYDKDAVAADLRFDGRLVRVTGRHTGLSFGPSGDPVMLLGGENPVLGVSAAFDKVDAEKLAAIPVGSTTTVECLRVTYVATAPGLSECRL